MSFLFKSKKQHQPPQQQQQHQQQHQHQQHHHHHQQNQRSFAPPRLISSSHGASSSANPPSAYQNADSSSSSQPSSVGPHPGGAIHNALQSTTANVVNPSGGASREHMSSANSHSVKQYPQQSNPIRPRPSDTDLGRNNGPTHSHQQQQQPRPSTANGPAEKYYYPIDPSSPFPWSLRLTNYSPSPGQTYETSPPLPRYGAAVNCVCDKDKQIYAFGGLMGTDPTNDLWILDCSGLVKTVPIPEIDDRMKNDLAVPKHTDTGTVFTSLTFRKVKPKGKVPSERVGHAALLAGNAFIVFGGDTPTKVNDKLDDTLYFFNTAENQMSWTAPECRNRPAGRYGHTLTLIGNHIYLFGGQCEHIFFNDMYSYDLNKIQTDPSWTQIKQHPNAPCPPPRTNHSMTTWNGKLYLFGGTDGVTWYNDVWCFDPASSSWTEMNCIGYIPLAREGHAAALVDDMMYVIGGRVRDGAALRELAAFKISSGRWFSFQNMGIPPSARSGHSMTTIDNQVVIIGGHSDALEINELRYAYVLDTKKIAFDNSAAAQTQPAPQRVQQPQLQQQTSQQPLRKNTADGAGLTTGSGAAGGNLVEKNPSRTASSGPASRSQTPSHQQLSKGQEPVSGSRLPRATGGGSASAAAGGHGHTRLASTGRNTPSTTVASDSEPKRSASSLGHGGSSAGHGGAAASGPGTQVSRSRSMSKTKDSQPQQYLAYNPNLGSSGQAHTQSQDQGQPNVRPGSQSGQTQRAESAQAHRDPREAHRGSRSTAKASADPPSGVSVVTTQKQGSAPSTAGTAPVAGSANTGAVSTTPSSATSAPAPNRPSRANTVPAAASTPVDSGIGSYGSSPVIVESQPALEDEKQKMIDNLNEQIKRLQLANSWYAGEVALASKAGYTPNPCPGFGPNGSSSSRFSPSLDHRASISNPDSLLPQISEEDKPLVQLLLRTRTELSQVQGRIDGEAQKAANRIAEMEKQRDRAIEEAVYFKAKLASIRSPTGTPIGERGGSAASLGGAHGNAHGRQSVTPTPTSEDAERASGLDRRLAEAVAARNVANKEIEALRNALEAEKRACAVAQANARASQEQMAALNSYQQRASSEIEGLKAQLHEATQRVRDEVARANAADGREKMAQIEAADARRKISAFLGENLGDDGAGADSGADGVKGGVDTKRDSEGSFSSQATMGKKSGFEALIAHLRASLSISAERADVAEKKAKEERERAEQAESVLSELRTEAENLKTRVQALTRRAEEAETLSKQHSEEAQRHRAIIEGGLEKLVEQEGADLVASYQAKISVLETQLKEAEALVAKSLADTRAAEENVRQAQERIAGLETFQATTSLENLKVRDQLQSVTVESNRLGAEVESLNRKLEETGQERDMLKIQLDTLSVLVEEHGLREDGEHHQGESSGAAGGRSGDSASSARVADLEQRLNHANQARADLEQEFAKHEAELQSQWTSRLDKLETDYQTATRQVASLEQVVSQMTHRTKKVETRAKQFKELNHELRMRLEYAEGRLLSYISQDMDATGLGADGRDPGDGDDDADDDDDMALSSASSKKLRPGNVNGLLSAGGHTRDRSSLSLSSADDYEGQLLQRGMLLNAQKGATGAARLSASRLHDSLGSVSSTDAARRGVATGSGMNAAAAAGSGGVGADGVAPGSKSANANAYFGMDVDEDRPNGLANGLQNAPPPGDFMTGGVVTSAAPVGARS